MSADPRKPLVQLFTDGACSGNPGPGGWAFILRHLARGESPWRPDTGREIEQAGGETRTTNNRMELTAVIEGLSTLTHHTRVELFCDSQYVLNGLDEWMDGWKAKGWTRSGRKHVLNVDLWQTLHDLRHVHEIHCHWIRGHRGHPENERADRLAVEQIERFRGGATTPRR